jgi:hypothetical protein
MATDPPTAPLMFSSIQRITIGMLGGIAALCTKFLAHDYSTLSDYLSANRYGDALNLGIGYVILGPILVFLGGLLAWVNESENSRMKLLAIGIAAPALITTAAGAGGASTRTSFLSPFDNLLTTPAQAQPARGGRIQVAQNIEQGLRSFFGASKVAQFVVFLHYREDVPHSASFVEVAKQKLLALGFAVPNPSIEGGGARVQDTAGPDGEGPHVDYFPNADDASLTQAARDTAQRVASVLNESKPSQLGPFVIKREGPLVGAYANQSYFIGVWF